MSPVRPAQLLVPTILLLFTACGESAAAGLSLDPPIGLKQAQLTPSPDNPLSIDKAELGKVLFFEPRLSGSGKMSCSTCHLPEKAWTDGKDFSEKDNGSKNTRNTPSMYNVGYWTKWYWDGRTSTLESNAKAAWTAQMQGKPEEVAKTLAAVPAYKEMFRKAFDGAEPTADNIPMALASFLRVLRSGDSPFDQFQAGNQDALSNAAKIGYELFTGSAGCTACHQVAPAPLFTDKLFHNVGIGLEDPHKDLGAYGVKDKVPEFADEKYMHAFKTPSLRNVALTAPYFSDASAKTLKDAVKFMASGGKDNPHKDPGLVDKKLSDTDIDNLVAFLESLTDNPKFTAPKIPQ